MSSSPTFASIPEGKELWRGEFLGGTLILALTSSILPKNVECIYFNLVFKGGAEYEGHTVLMPANSFASLSQEAVKLEIERVLLTIVEYYKSISLQEKNHAISTGTLLQ